MTFPDDTNTKKGVPPIEGTHFSEMMHIILQICSQDVLISQIPNLAETRSALFCFVLVSERLHSRKEQDIADSGGVCHEEASDGT